MTTPPKRGPLDRKRLAKVLAMLESSHDGEVLAAARLAASMLREAGLGWSDLVPDTPTPSEDDTADLKRLDDLLAASHVTDVLKMRLRTMRVALRNGSLAMQDRRLILILHRKAVMDGTIVEP
jgi:hypothetical protein